MNHVDLAQFSEPNKRLDVRPLLRAPISVLRSSWDWEHLGPATAVQILDDPGIPEKPGDSED